MPAELDEEMVRAITAPPKGNTILYDATVKGFGCRVTAAGAKSFVLNYRTRDGRERRFTIGQHPGWKVKAARKEAESIKARLKGGYDPLGDLEKERAARREELAQVTVDTLCDRFEALHLPKKSAATQRDYKGIIKLWIRPELGALKVRDVNFTHVDKLHRKVSKVAPTRANRVVAVLSKMFSFAGKTPATDHSSDIVPMRPDGINPAKGLERNAESKRDRYLSKVELAALMKALDEAEDRQASDVIRLLVLTGARKSETLAARWSDFDLVKGTWTKPGTTTKQKTLHHVPLSPPAIQLLKRLRADLVNAAAEKGKAVPNDGPVFPGRNVGQPHRAEIKGAWVEICIAAGLVKADRQVVDGEERTVLKTTARIHDLRHTYASLLASSGLSLPIIGALLGHTQASTTQRYAHLISDALREATERVGEIVSPAEAGQ